MSSPPLRLIGSTRRCCFMVKSLEAEAALEEEAAAKAVDVLLNAIVVGLLRAKVGFVVVY